MQPLRGQPRHVPASGPPPAAAACLTMPATSEPSTAPAGSRPERASLRSPRLSATWWTSTTTSCGFGIGSDVSPRRTAEGVEGSTISARIGRQRSSRPVGPLIDLEVRDELQSTTPVDDPHLRTCRSVGERLILPAREELLGGDAHECLSPAAARRHAQGNPPHDHEDRERCDQETGSRKAGRHNNAERGDRQQPEDECSHHQRRLLHVSREPYAPYARRRGSRLGELPESVP